ncbi:MAG TPA: sigma-70 family RNA polymerase sigma factor [Polyangia bacterium]|nr:sigma-70 family RNA polymerase sigma factor [Polyangia bacterium]
MGSEREGDLRRELARARPDVALPTDAEARLTELVGRARRAFPELAFDAARFVAALGRAAGDDLGAGLAELHVEDFALAVACADGVPGALERCDRQCGAAIAAAVARIDSAEDFRDEVRQILWHRVFVGTPNQPPRIASYSGRGPLAAWVAVAAQRVAIDLRRSALRAAPVDPEADDLLPASVHPEADYLRGRYRPEFEAAVRAALAGLPDRDRLLLRLTIVSGMSHEQVGAIYGVNQSTVSRWIARARAEVLAATERDVCARLNLPHSEFLSLAGLFLTDLDLSLSRVLHAEE